MPRSIDTGSRVPGDLLQRREIHSLFVHGWQDGWLPHLEETNAPGTSLTDLLNVRWNPDYTISKRQGYRNIADAVSGLGKPDFVFAPRVFTSDGLFPQYSQVVSHFNDSDAELYYQSLGELWAEFKSPTAGGDMIASGHGIGSRGDSAPNRFRTWPVSCVVYESDIYYFGLRFGGFDPDTDTEVSESGWATVDGSSDSQSKPIKFDVEAGTFSRPDVANLETGETTGHFPQARTGLTKYARIFMANTYLQGTHREPSRIYWSGSDTDPIDVGIWDKDNYIEVGTDDGQEIVRILSFGDQILILKNQSVWTLVGTDDTTFALYQLDDKLGTEGTYAATSTIGKAWFLDEREGVIQYDGAEFTNISDPIKDKLLAELNRDASYKSLVAWHQDLLYVSIPVGNGSSDDPSVTYVYDTRLQVWTRWNYGIVPDPFPMYTDYTHSGITFAKSNNMFGGIYAAGVYEFNEGLNDDGDAISSYVTTPWMKFTENLGTRFRLRRLDVLADEGDAAITINVYTDLKSSAVKKTYTFDPATGTQNALDQSAVVDDFTFQYVALKFVQNGDDEDMNLWGWGMSLSGRPTPRGRKSETGYGAA
jgi:hypothetical protein